MNTESTLQRLVRKALTKRQHFNADGTPKDLGVGVTGVVVTIIILGILAAVGGPPLFAIIFDAREFKLENNVQEAAQVLHQRLTLSPDQMNDGVNATAGTTEGAPNGGLTIDLVEDAPYIWEDNWTFAGTDNDETIRVQFLKSGAAAVATGAAPSTATPPVWTAAVPPVVDWLGTNWRAVRLHARNSDGRWACALIVVQAEVPAAKASDGTFYLGVASGLHNGLNLAASNATVAALGPEVHRSNTRLANAWMNGIWYDSGEVITADGGLHDCSPVDVAAPNTDKATLPASAQNWQIEDVGTTNAIRTFSRSL